jgi:hypothetical protein
MPRRTPAPAAELLTLGLGCCVISFGLVATLVVRSTMTEPTAPPPAVHSINAPDLPLARLDRPADRSVVRQDLRGQGDLRTFLRESASAALRHPSPDTQTEIWLNNPSSIGSTSPS